MPIVPAFPVVAPVHTPYPLVLTLGSRYSFPRDAVSLRDGPAGPGVTGLRGQAPTEVQIARSVDEALDAIDRFG